MLKSKTQMGKDSISSEYPPTEKKLRMVILEKEVETEVGLEGI